MKFASHLFFSERGNATLFVLAIVPIALSISVLAVDVSGFQSLRARAQKEADRIALQAIKALPDTELARAIVAQNIAQLPDLELASDESGAAQLFVDAQSLTLALSGSKDAMFDSFLPSEQFFEVREFATAARVPQDIVVIFPDGHSLRPPARENWGDANLWPASAYFNFVSNPRPRGLPTPEFAEEGVYWPNWWNEFETERYRRWATQSCFNPVFSSLKLSVLGLLDRLTALSSTRIGLIFSPGDDARTGFAVARKLSSLAVEGPEAAWFDVMELPTFFGDEACLLFAHPETASADRYSLPSRSTRSPSLRAATADCTDIFRTTGWGSLWYPNGHLEDCFQAQALSLREAIYYRASRSTALSKDGTHIIAALNEAVVQLAEGASRSEQQSRGALAQTPQRRILLFTDVVPSSDNPDLQAVLKKLQALEGELVLAAYAHDGLSKERAALLEEATSGFRALPNTRLIAIRGESEILSAEIREALQGGEEYVLRR